MDREAEAAFREFVTACSPGLMRLAFLLTGDHGHAEDAVQSTLSRVYLSWDRIRSRDVPQVLDAYARRTLTRVVLSWQRRRRVKLVLTHSVPESPPPGSETTQFDDALLRALLALPVRQRAVIVLRFVEDRSEAEVAQMLGVSVGAVKQHAHRGLARLRAVLTTPSEVPVTESPPGAPQIAARLRALSDASAHPLEPDAIIAAAHRRSRQRTRWSVASAATVLAVTAAITVPLTLSGSHAGSLDLSIPLPTTPAGSTDEEFRLAAPGAGQLVIGGVPPRTATCTPQQISATALTRRTSGGVLGVIRLRGAVISRMRGIAVRCALPVRQGPTALLDSEAHQLTVPLLAGDITNPPANLRSDIPLAAGDAIWGFAWLGSHCGPRAVTIQIPLSGEARAQMLSARLTGPQPMCTSGQSTSSLIDGIAGAPGQPVQPPLPEYSALRLTGRIQPGTSSTQLAPIDLTIRNTGDSPVSLDPCPAYAGRDFATARSGGFGDPISQGYLPCTTRRLVIEPGQSYDYTVPATSLVQTSGTGAIPGTTVRVTLGIAGLPMLTLTATVGSTETAAHRPITLGSHGLGAVDFGTSKEQRTVELTRLLGPPTGQGPNTGCGPTFTEVNWGELAVEFHNDVFTGYRDINRPYGSRQLGPGYPAGYTTFYPVGPAAKTAAGITLGDTLGQVKVAYPTLTLAGANRWRTPDALSFVDNSPRSPAPPQARIIEIRVGTCGSY